MRAGVTKVLIPKDNEKDLADIPDYVKEKVELIPVAHLDEVFALIFKDKTKKTEAAKTRNTVGGAKRSALGRVK